MTATAVRFDLDDPAILRDPYPALRALRDHEPLHVNGDGSYLVTRYADVAALLGDPRAVAERPRGANELDALPTPSVARGLRPHIEELVDQLLDRASDHRFDVVTDVAVALAMQVAALLLDWSGDVRALLGEDHLSAADLTGNAVLALLDFPDEADRLRREPALIRCAVDEVLRYDTPMPTVLRTAAKPIELAWGIIERGSQIQLSIAAANHDPHVFANPEQLRIARVDNPHLSFGLDRHRCIGAALAMLQCEVIIGKLFERFSWIELDGFLERKQQPGVRGLASLPVRVIPR